MSRCTAKKVRGQLALWSVLPSGQGTWGSPEDWKGRRVHFIGIGGIGMSGLARLLRDNGSVVTGCDAVASEITASLVDAGVPVWVGHSPEHLDNTDVVITSAAVRDTNPELCAARRRGLRVVKYAQALGALMAGRDGVAVAGSHGKTTTTSMIAYALNVAKRDPAMVIGGLVPQLGGNARAGGGRPFVVEACEYDRSFLNLTPRAAVITNIDRDHLDYYSGLDELVEAFACFAGRVRADGLVAVNGDDPRALRAAARASARVETFGESQGCTWRLEEWHRENGVTRFRVSHGGCTIGEFQLLVPGLYNVKNAIACLAVCRHFGLAEDEAREALRTFRGVRRRFDRLGEANGVIVLDDYGHHPTEVRVTLDAVRAEFPGRRLWCVFQPHQCSRTRILLKEFATSFAAADRVIVPDIYSVRDSDADRRSIHARDLVRELQRSGVAAQYEGAFDRVVGLLLGIVEPGDLVMTMGAGPVDRVGRCLLDELKNRERKGELASRS